MKSTTIVLLVVAGIAYSQAGVIAPKVAVVNSLHAIPNYQTSYSVSDKLTGDRKSATEKRVGDVTKGSYSILQPDGVLRTVIYQSSPLTGFQAQVINTGKAIHPPIIGGRLVKGVGSAVALRSPAIGVAGSIGVVGVKG